MDKQDKQLLLKALCGYIPYRVQALAENVFSEPEDVEIEAVTSHQEAKLDGYNFTVDIQDLKPYLRPMSSMTEEEKRELSKKYVWDINCGQIEIRYHSDGYWDDNIECPTREYLNLFDWLNAHHFDYRGLIEKELALEAPDGMY